MPLLSHLKDVADAAVGLVRASGVQQLMAFGLPEAEWHPRLLSALPLAAAVHDLGKANNQFQPIVHESREHQRLFETQDIRHEWVSFWILTQPSVEAWLKPAVDDCDHMWLAILCAVAGHHPKSERLPPNENKFSGKPIEIYSQHEDFLECLEWMKDRYSLGVPPRIDGVIYGGADDIIRSRQFVNCIDERWDAADDLIRDHYWRRFIACVKASLICADVAGSAFWDRDVLDSDRQTWIEESLSRSPESDGLERLIEYRLGGEPPREFQVSVAKSAADVTLVEAGCGTGKTIAAYMWAAQQHPGKRLWVCYPTTGTATEGYRSYLHHLEDGKDFPGAELFHSRSDYDKLTMLSSETGVDQADESLRIESLAAWETSIVCCTVDTVLCILQNQRRGLYAWPAMAHSVIVFDEVHCYDDKLFGNLLTFLKQLTGIPVLLMTASLPKSRRTAIESVTKGGDRSLAAIGGPASLEELERYNLDEPAGTVAREEALDAAIDECSGTGRVLWISNTVDRCKAVGRDLTEQSPIVYHSRFLYRDRQQRHLEVVKLFDADEPGVATTTQVAELSLDLKKATLLITELAPIPSLIQRLGRLNRQLDPTLPAEDRPVRRFVVIEPVSGDEFSAAPYEPEQLELARAWLQLLVGRPLSQRDLIAAWSALDDTASARLAVSNWLDGGLETPVDGIREGSFGVTVIRNEDVAEARREGMVTGFTLPMNRPRSSHWSTGWRCGGFEVAADGTINYDPREGANWATHILF